MAPSQGRVVIFHQPESEKPHNGSFRHPAIVNHVFGGNDYDEFPAINCTVFPDCAPPESRTSVPHRSKVHQASIWWDWPPRI